MGRWLRLIVVLIVLLALAWIALNLGNALLGLVRGADIGSGGEQDPMFAQETVSATRPPEIYPEETQKPHKTLDDYVPEEEAPVYKTAQELILEAQNEG